MHVPLTIAIDAALCELEKECFGRGHAAHARAFADGNHLAQDRLVGRMLIARGDGRRDCRFCLS